MIVLKPSDISVRASSSVKVTEIYEKNHKQTKLGKKEVILGRIDKGEKCSVSGCEKDAVRSIAASKVAAANLKVDAERRAYLCKDHYKEFKKATKKDRTMERWRYGSTR